jgi:hypothetical protein
LGGRTARPESVIEGDDCRPLAGRPPFFNPNSASYRLDR